MVLGHPVTAGGVCGRGVGIPSAVTAAAGNRSLSVSLSLSISLSLPLFSLSLPLSLSFALSLYSSNQTLFLPSLPTAAMPQSHSLTFRELFSENIVDGSHPLCRIGQLLSLSLTFLCVCGREEPLDVGAEGADTQTCQRTNVKETHWHPNPRCGSSFRLFFHHFWRILRLSRTRHLGTRQETTVTN